MPGAAAGAEAFGPGDDGVPECRWQTGRHTRAGRLAQREGAGAEDAGPGRIRFLCLPAGLRGQSLWAAQSLGACAYETRRPAVSHRADASLRTPEDRSLTGGAAAGVGAHDLSRRARPATRGPADRRRSRRGLYAAPRV